MGKDSSGSCSATGSSDKIAAPEPPQNLRVTRSESRSLTIEWRAHPDGTTPETYALRTDPGSQETSLDHDVFDPATGAQLHTVTGLRPNTEYTIRLQAVNKGGSSS